jgi:preprotein translocase subunit SecF
MEKWAIMIVKKFYGDKKAEAREIELISPKRLNRNGLIALILGAVCLMMVILTIFE